MRYRKARLQRKLTPKEERLLRTCIKTCVEHGHASREGCGRICAASFRRRSIIPKR